MHEDGDDQAGAMMEASVASFVGYGKPLDETDLARYRTITDKAGIPVIAPSQRKFVPDDMQRLKVLGIAPLLRSSLARRPRA